MAELGETNDPAALIPGNTDAVHDTVWQLTSYGDALYDAGTGLQRIDTTEGWSGEAAEAFRGIFHGQPSKWLDAGDAFHDAARALDAYASTLTWAQAQAAKAIRLWNEGNAATRVAEAQHDQAVQQHALAASTAGLPIVTAQLDMPSARLSRLGAGWGRCVGCRCLGRQRDHS